VEVEVEGAVIADGYALDPVYPNPFNATLTVPFTLTESMNVSIELFGVSMNFYSILGQKMMTVVNREFGAGSYNYTVQANDLASGIYFVRTSFNGRSHMQKAVLLK
ncbi:MAG: T9SS type A sorting domain-containing protein, partial [Candidatus Marinimicrobia bacterium]|nr:T9SS type A sorting domain-containing protein [Candidatus Neomarinimicrobiota bacterium]